MADKKISALTSATTPLAGTEVLPIVQSGSTVKATVANIVGAGTSPGSFTTLNATDNITAAGTGAKYIIAQTTSTNGQSVAFRVVAPNSDASANSYQVGTGLTADNEWTVQDLTSSQTVDKYIRGSSGFRAFWVNGTEYYRINSSGNLVVNSAAKGINFTANTPAAGMTSQLLNWYEEGTWTPTLQGGTTAGSYTLNNISAYYTRVGRQVTVNARFDVTVNSAGTGTAKFGGLPFSKGSSQYATGTVYTSGVTYAANIISLAIQSWTSGASTDFAIAGVRSGTTPSDLDITGFATGNIVYFTFTYFV
jgi:hypothetical protein